MRGSRNPPAPTKNSSIRTGCWSFCFVETHQENRSGWIRTASAAVIRPGGKKSPCGAFLDARLAQSTRAHQENACVEIHERFSFAQTANSRKRVDSNRAAVRSTVNNSPVQRRRPLPAAETGRSCWGRVLIFQSLAKRLWKNQQTQPVAVV